MLSLAVGGHHTKWPRAVPAPNVFVELGGGSHRHSFWAQVYYQQQRDKGKAHRRPCALAFKWIRILYRCWQTRTPYNEALYTCKRSNAVVHPSAQLGECVLKRVKHLDSPPQSCLALSPDATRSRRDVLWRRMGAGLELCAVIGGLRPSRLVRLVCALGYPVVAAVLTRCGLPLPVYVLANRRNIAAVSPEKVYLRPLFVATCSGTWALLERAGVQRPSPNSIKNFQFPPNLVIRRKVRVAIPIPLLRVRG